MCSVLSELITTFVQLCCLSKQNIYKTLRRAIYKTITGSFNLNYGVLNFLLSKHKEYTFHLYFRCSNFG